MPRENTERSTDFLATTHLAVAYEQCHITRHSQLFRSALKPMEGRTAQGGDRGTSESVVDHLRGGVYSRVYLWATHGYEQYVSR